MTVSLAGNSPSTLTAGILLLSRARTFGQRLDVEIVGDPAEVTPVLGPALVHSPVLASCGVGRELGAGALVIVPGPPLDAIAASLSADGTGPWFLLDRAGEGEHPATRGFVALCRDPRPEVRRLGRDLRRSMAALGSPPEPAVLDLLFGAPAPPLQRVTLALRAGRAMLGGPPDTPIGRVLLGGGEDAPDPIPVGEDDGGLRAARRDGRIAALLDRFSLSLRDGVEEWFDGALAAAEGDPDRGALLRALVELAGHLASLPTRGMLAPLEAAMDSVAVGLGPALGASHGQADANAMLAETYRFLGGRFTGAARHPVAIDDEAPPSDRIDRWRWFCAATRNAADAADGLWRKVVDPVQ